MQTRIYRPLTVAELRRLASNGSLEPAPFTAYAVTADLRREHPAADEEELEYLAFVDAASNATTRVLAAADVDEELLSDLVVAGDVVAGDVVSAVLVSAPVPRRQVVSFHVADRSSSPDGAGGIPEFSWYDATELEVVMDLLASR